MLADDDGAQQVFLRWGVRSPFISLAEDLLDTLDRLREHERLVGVFHDDQPVLRKRAELGT